MIEQWRPVVGYEGWYEVSDVGRVRRVHGGRGARVGRILKPNLNAQTGYMYVDLKVKNTRTHVPIHRLVAQAFHVRPTKEYQVNHKDADKLNNRAENLEWVTSGDNTRHAARLGCLRVGSQCSWAKLTDEAVHTIRSLRGRTTQAVVAHHFNVSPSTIGSIFRGESWAHHELSADDRKRIEAVTA